MACRCRTEHCSYCVPRVEKPSSGTHRSFLGPSTYVSLETIHLVGGLEGVLLGICILEKFPSYIWLILLAESHWSRRENDLHALHVKMSLAARPWVRFRSESLRPGNLPAQPENSRGRVLSCLINTMWIWRGGFPRGTNAGGGDWWVTVGKWVQRTVGSGQNPCGSLAPALERHRS